MTTNYRTKFCQLTSLQMQLMTTCKRQAVKEVFRADPELMHYPLYICTVVGIAFALFFTIIGSVLSVVNSVMTPVEKINGAVGLYTWNGLSALCCLASLTSWTLEFQWKLSHNVMSPDERRQQWNSAGLATIGWSFLLVVLGLLLNLCNVVVIILADKKPWLKPRTVPVHPKVNQGAVIMLY
ncbi:clarin-3-like isoform X3 [Varroa jacobsoni]|uniref:clarin-3-like isoform X3 n=1 Tax=Varroa jacobsoni TaxID=62625 RepID=UPI000BF82548|nr:clarin-3-like isoform X3 [Varroa jacobsoni]